MEQGTLEGADDDGGQEGNAGSKVMASSRIRDHAATAGEEGKSESGRKREGGKAERESV